MVWTWDNNLTPSQSVQSLLVFISDIFCSHGRKFSWDTNIFGLFWNNLESVKLGSPSLSPSTPFSVPSLVRNPSLCCFTSVLVCWSSGEIFWKYFKFKNISHPAASVQFPAWRSVEISNFFLILNFWTRLSLKLVWNKFEIF